MTHKQIIFKWSHFKSYLRDIYEPSVYQCSSSFSMEHIQKSKVYINSQQVINSAEKIFI